MKIALVNTLYHPNHIGGAEKSVQFLAEALVGEGFECHVITLSPEGLEGTERHNNVSIHRIPLDNRYWPFSNESRSPLQRLQWHLKDLYNRSCQRRMEKLLKQIAPDIVHTNNLAGMSVAVWRACKRQGIAIAHSARDYYLIHPNCKLYANGANQNPDSLTCKVWSFLKKRESNLVDALLSISDHMRDIHIEHGFFRNAHAETIYNPIVLPAEITPRSREGHSEAVFGFIGRLDESKGIETLLQVFNNLDKHHRLVIAGTGDAAYLNELRALARHPNIEFIGHVKPCDFFERIDYLVVPSIWAEPLGRVVLEAYSYGVPVLGSEAGGIPEIIKSGTTGLTFRPYSPADLQEKIQQIQKISHEQLSENCLQYSKNFSHTQIVGRFIDAYKKAIDRNSGSGESN